MWNTFFISDSTIEDIATGSRDAFRLFYDVTYPHIYRFIHYLLPNREDCEEVVSEVFYIVWKQRKNLSSINDLKSWLYIVSRNEAFHYLKQKEKYRNISIDDMPVELQIDPTMQENSLIELEMFEVYNKAIKTLPERCKLIFLMVREESMKHKEIAKVLSITEGTVEQQMNIAIRKIIDIVKEYYPYLNYKRHKK